MKLKARLCPFFGDKIGYLPSKDLSLFILSVHYRYFTLLTNHYYYADIY